MMLVEAFDRNEVFFRSKVPYLQPASLPIISLYIPFNNKKQRISIMWTKPAYTDLRIGFEVTMYFANR